MAPIKKSLYLLLNIIIPISVVQAQLSPDGLVIGQDLPEKDKTWYFCPNGNLQATEDVYPEKSIYQGRWELKDGEIVISLKTQYGRRGIGEQWVKEEHKGFNIYTDFVNEIDEQVRFNWSKVAQQLDNDTSEFTLVKENYICPSVLYTPELPGDYPIASYKLLSEEDLQGFSVEELSLMRNEIFARYGLKFSRSVVLNHFMDKAWYFPENNSVEIYLTNVEKRNLRTIAAFVRKLNQ